MHLHSSHSVDFNPRAPCGARPSRNASKIWKQVFQSTRPVRGATAVEAHPDLDYTFQSTRPVRGATRQAELFEEMEEFQSTRPVRGATLRPALRSCRESISIHAPRARRDVPNLLVVPPALISIHAPRAGRDEEEFLEAVKKFEFQSTRPVRGATTWSRRAGRLSRHFNPRAPCGARHPTRALHRPS